MSSVQSFRAKVNGNAELEQAIRNLMDQNGLLDLTAATKLGAQYGYIFNEEEIIALFANDNEELSDFELEMVSAGAPINCARGSKQL